MNINVAQSHVTTIRYDTIRVCVSSERIFNLKLFYDRLLFCSEIKSFFTMLSAVCTSYRQLAIMAVAFPVQPSTAYFQYVIVSVYVYLKNMLIS